MGRNGFILWVQEEGPEWPEQGSKRKRLEGRFFFFFFASRYSFLVGGLVQEPTGQPQ